VKSVEIDKSDTALTLSEKLAYVGADLLIETLENYHNITLFHRNMKNLHMLPLLKRKMVRLILINQQKRLSV